MKKLLLGLSALVSLVLVGALAWPGFAAYAQTPQPGEQAEGPVYIVQEGDTLWDIAFRFGVSWEDLARVNDIGDPGQLAAGDELIIPGLEGVEGTLVTSQVPLGEDLRSLSRRYGLPVASLIQLNRLTGPAELFQGASLVVPQGNLASPAGMRIGLTEGQSLLELAAARQANPWSLLARNGLEAGWQALPGDVLRLDGEESQPGPGALPGGIASITLSPEPLVQGDTGLIQLESQPVREVSGQLLGKDLHFFPDPDQAGIYLALQGVHAMTEPGLYPLTIRGQLADGTPFGFTQMVPVVSGDYNYYTLTVPPETIDPANTGPEDELWSSLATAADPERRWQGVFSMPVAQPSPCGYTSYFGERRSYNGSPYNYFHTGLDFCYNYNLEVNEIYAPAAGRVVFAGPLTVRGNAVMIDHGWGIFTGYMHMDEIFVQKGDEVETGQVIGTVGETGRVNGPHLHFEVWVGGVQVDPLDWLENAFP